MTLWESCRGPDHLGPLAGTLHRMVESQARIATLDYVDTLAEQALLEDLLETVKPPLPAGSGQLHYLLKTPFRYPPLPWGSRFGRRHEPALCYGGCRIETTLAEVAYYRCVFWQSMAGAPPADSIRTQHSSFAVRYRTDAGIALQREPFARYAGAIAHRADYTATQALGSAMRAAGVAAFEYPSARDPHRGTCVGLFTPAAFAERKPRAIREWLCEVSATAVAFKPVDTAEVARFTLDAFLVAGSLPRPA
ncbi:MAG: RES family NAD+ phosphorylase [Gammaproteobacteria bacterium]